jgi:peptide/nickel transport system substrate-binding protein
VNNGGWEYLAPLSWIELNHRVKPLDDVRVRLAISHAIDRSVIVNRLWFGAGKAATSPIASGTRFFDPSVKLPAYDPRLAATLLNGAGLLAGADGVRFSLRHLVAPYGEVWTRLSAYLRASLARVGIDLRLETTDAAAWAARIAAWDYDTSVSFAYQYGDPTLGVERSYVSDNIRNVAFANTGGYVNRRVDALFARARLATDPNQRQAAFSAVQKVLAADVPQIWLMEMAFPAIHARRLHDAVRLGTGVHACFDDVSLG